jgi:uncharacterized protein
MLKRLYFVFLFLSFLTKAQTYPAKPGNYVTDETGTLTQEQQATLNAKLKAFEDTTTNQIFVYMTASLNGQDLAQYSQDIFHNWKIGQKDKNNGVLIAVFKDDRKFRIQTGYGLEGALPDLLTKRIQDNDMRPLFKQGDYYGGINAGIEMLAYYCYHEFDAEILKEKPVSETPYSSYWKSWAMGYWPNILLLILYIRNIFKKGPNKKSKKQKKAEAGSLRKYILLMLAVVIAFLPCFGAIILFFMFVYTADFKGFSGKGSYSSSSSSWSDSDSSSWSSSDSSSSSDFGGGGGGDSGGGGSSSDW